MCRFVKEYISCQRRDNLTKLDPHCINESGSVKAQINKKESQIVPCTLEGCGADGYVVRNFAVDREETNPDAKKNQEACLAELINYEVDDTKPCPKCEKDKNDAIQAHSQATAARHKESEEATKQMHETRSRPTTSSGLRNVFTSEEATSPAVISDDGVTTPKAGPSAPKPTGPSRPTAVKRALPSRSNSESSASGLLASSSQTSTALPRGSSGGGAGRSRPASSVAARPSSQVSSPSASTTTTTTPRASRVTTRSGAKPPTKKAKERASSQDSAKSGKR